MTQVRNATGYNRVTRTADALAMSLWPSRGLHLHGFEIKVSRHDWLRELKNPEKAEEIAQYCHFWWVVAPDGVVPAEEVPANWGLLALKAGKFHIQKQAVFTEAKSMTWPMLASIFRNINTSMTPTSMVDQVVNDRVNEARTRIEDRKDQEHKYHLQKLETYQEFEKLSGIEMRTWDKGNVANAVKAILSEDRFEDRLQKLKQDADMIAKQIGEVLDTREPANATD